MNNPPAKTRRPHMLLAFRKVEHFYAEVVRSSSASVNMSASLGYQMQESVKDLMGEFKAFGKDYELFLEGGFHGNDLHRWNLFVNGEHLATIDKDYGYDCFDISATCFKDTISALIELSDIQPLTKTEREVLDAQLKAQQIIRRMVTHDDKTDKEGR